MAKLNQKASEGRAFDYIDDRINIKVSAKDTGGAYSLMHWTVAAEATAPAHVHDRYEETFYVLSGALNFLLGQDTIPMEAGDFVRVPAGTRHGYQNASGNSVELLVGFTPGGMEELFYKYRTEESDFDINAYVVEARELHGTEYELDD